MIDENKVRRITAQERIETSVQVSCIAHFATRLFDSDLLDSEINKIHDTLQDCCNGLEKLIPKKIF